MMKKRVMMVLLAVTMILPGCGKMAETDTNTVYAERVANSMLDVTVAISKDVLDMVAEHKEEIARRKSNFPSAHYPEATWTVDGVIDSYLEQTAQWSVLPNNREITILYSQDYEDCFTIYDGWLEVNDVRVMPLANVCYADLSPKALLEKYQSGVWDGEGSLWSTDFSTQVTIYDGCLQYEYRKDTYTEEADPDGLAYKFYDEPMELLSEDEPDGYHAWRRSNTYDGGRGHEAYILKTTVAVCVDLPNGTTDNLDNEVIYSRRINSDIGTYVMTNKGVDLYCRGELIDHWNCETGVGLPDMHYFEDDVKSIFKGETHVWTSDDKIIRLLPGGETELILDNLVDNYVIGEYPLLDLALDDNGKLTGYSRYCGLVEIAEDIASVDFAWDVTLMTGTDGKCYMFGISDYMEMKHEVDRKIMAAEPLENSIETHLLGDESWEYYFELYKNNDWELPENADL